jgi:hypothetical protein
VHVEEDFGNDGRFQDRFEDQWRLFGCVHVELVCLVVWLSACGEVGCAEGMDVNNLDFIGG